MNEPVTSTAVVTINVAPAVEERLIDWLLGREEVAGFTSYAAYGHGSRHDELSIAEQVTGRQRRMEMRTELPHDAIESFLEALTAAFAGTDLYYSVLPVLRSGHLQRRAD
jgi:hypothetical protein